MATTVKQWMTGDPVSLTAEASALEALELMVDRGIRHLPVVEDGGIVIGVLSQNDLRAALPLEVERRNRLGAEDRGGALEWCVGDLMTHAPLCIGPQADLAEAAEKMAGARVGCLPVVDEAGRLEAILTETDLLHALATALWSERLQRGERDRPLVELVNALRSERDRLLAELARHRRSEEELASTLLDEPLDQAEEASDRSEILALDRLDDRARRRVEAIEHALKRAEAGRLSVCDQCEGGIPMPRLRALPGTTVCVACAREAEARLHR